MGILSVGTVDHIVHPWILWIIGQVCFQWVFESAKVAPCLFVMSIDGISRHSWSEESVWFGTHDVVLLVSLDKNGKT